MNTLRKYLVSTFAAIALSLTLASVTAQAWCPEIYEFDDIICYKTAEDDEYCYYECYWM